MPFTPSIKGSKKLTLQDAKQITGEWLTYCRVAKQPGELAPPIVLAAAKVCAADRNSSMTQKDWVDVAKTMREKRIKKGYASAAAIANRFPKSIYAGKAKLVISTRRTDATKRPVGKAEWTEAYLEIAHEVEGYAHRFKISHRKPCYRLARLKAGKPPANAPQTVPWSPVTLQKAANISPIARRFLFHMLSNGETEVALPDDAA